MRFAVRRPGSPVASPRSHRMPCGDIPGRVHVGVQRISAGHAAEKGLALAAARCDVPTRRAPLARVSGTYLLNPAGGLVLQTVDQQAPPLGEDASIQPGFLPDILAWFYDGTPCRTGHVPDLQVLNSDHVEPPGNACRCLFAPVLANVRAAGLETGDSVSDLRTTLRLAVSPRQFPLQLPQPPLLRCGQPRAVQQLTGGQGRADGYPSVYADGLASSRPRCGFRDGGESNMPAPSPVPLHPIRLHILRYLPGPAEPHPPGLGHPDLPGVTVQPPDVLRPNVDDSEPLVSVGLPPRWAAMSPGQEVHHRLSVVTDRLLLHDYASRCQPRVRCPCRRELAAAFCRPRHAPAPRPPVRLLLNAQVPHVPSVCTVPQERRFLGCRWHQSVPRHTNTVATGYDILPRCVAHLIHSWLQAGASSGGISD